jgi:hypothetical protein
LNNNKKQTTKKVVKNLENNKDKLRHNNTIFNLIGILYFVAMLIVTALMLTKSSSALDTVSVVLFFGFFIIMFISGYLLKINKKEIFLRPIKICLIIAGLTYIFDFTATGINNFGLINVDSFDIYDIEQTHSAILDLNNKKLYFNSDSNDIYVVDEDAEVNKVSKFSVYKEEDFSKEVLDLTTKFNSLNKNVKFSYLIGNKNNEILIQIHQDGKRYLSQIKGIEFVEQLKSNDNLTETIYETKDFSIHIDNKFNLIGYFDNNLFSVNEFDKIETIEDTNYIERGFGFLTNRYPEEYIEAENMSIELVAEKIVNSDTIDKINLYSIRSQSSPRFFGISDVIEVVYKDKSSIISMVKVNSDFMKEGVEIEK